VDINTVANDRCTFAPVAHHGTIHQSEQSPDNFKKLVIRHSLLKLKTADYEGFSLQRLY
tara:strand:+ start:1294 stop:1470 length:177 start_codon:yes stop_codon:yes gene_type:complete